MMQPEPTHTGIGQTRIAPIAGTMPGRGHSVPRRRARGAGCQSFKHSILPDPVKIQQASTIRGANLVDSLRAIPQKEKHDE